MTLNRLRPSASALHELNVLLGLGGRDPSAHHDVEYTEVRENDIL